jgi:DNA-binding NarL/FixJ family response regulator
MARPRLKHPSADPEYVNRPDSPSLPPPQLDGLTDREVQVLTLLARGWSNKEVADRLYITPATTKSHVSRLLMKLGARDRAQLIVVAYEVGLVSPSS